MKEISSIRRQFNFILTFGALTQLIIIAHQVSIKQYLVSAGEFGSSKKLLKFVEESNESAKLHPNQLNDGVQELEAVKSGSGEFGLSKEFVKVNHKSAILTQANKHSDGTQGQLNVGLEQKIAKPNSASEEAQTFAYAKSDHQQEELKRLLRFYPSERNLKLFQRLTKRHIQYQLFYPITTTTTTNLKERAQRDTTTKGANQETGYRTNVVIKAFNYKLRLDLELNNNLFGPNLIQKHFLPKGGQQISTQKIEQCYYHAKTHTEARPSAIGAFRTCNGLSGIIHVNNESFVIHPFYDADLSKKHPHIIYRYQSAAHPTDNNQHQLLDPLEQQSFRQCGTSRLHEWALRQYNKQLSPVSNITPSDRFKRTKTHPLASGSRTLECAKDGKCDSQQEVSKPREANNSIRFNKRDVSLTEKYIELALILSKDMFDKRNSSSRLEVLHDAIQIVNCLDLYFRSANTRVALIYLETWAHGDQIDLSSNVKQTLYNFLEYSSRKLYKVSMDAVHLLTGGHLNQFEFNEMGMAIPDSICTSRAVSISQEASIFEPFIAASTMAHMLGHNLGMEHDPAGGGVASRSEQPARKAPQINPNHRQSSHGNGNGNGQEDEHEDEMRSRSVGIEPERAPEECGSSCLMSERFTYLQPPVSIGNMIQQQVVAGQANSSTLVTMFSVSASDSTTEQLNQIDNNELQNELVSSALPFKFSKQSLETYHKLLRLGRGICLFNKPNQLEDFRTCGNGIVDKGEDCDCGSIQECSENDSCCDPITCRFKADAECINGSCCFSCKLRQRGFVCRKARNECDLAELCDGKSSQCAPDVHKRNGQPCSSGQGYCYLGQCPQHDAQCAELWGSDARRSDRLCFETFNTNGTIRGNCGFVTDSLTTTSSSISLRGHHHLKYKRCEQENLMCGTLQCQMGDMKPVSSDNISPSSSISSSASAMYEFSKKSLHTHDGQHHECKVITGPLSNGGQHAISSISYVRDGTKCAQNRVCFNQTCQLIEQLFKDSFELCPRDERGRQCSNNGVCSTANRCHCDHNWIGHDCSQSAPVTVVSVAPEIVTEPPQASSTTTAAVSPVHEPATTTPTPAAATPSPTVSPSTVVQDRKKHDAFGAPTLVFILVSIVAAVYLGFALMANCYRRKGFLKPDKVLRHHQMNCRLDAIRSSLIAKQLADVDLSHQENGGGGGGDPPQAPFVSSISAQAPPQNCAHFYGFKEPLKAMPFQNPRASMSRNQQQFAGTGVYFEQAPMQLDAAHTTCIHQAAESCQDQVPLLSSGEQLANPMRSFMAQRPEVVYESRWQTMTPIRQQVAARKLAANRQCALSMNRTTSLGSVRRPTMQNDPNEYRQPKEVRQQYKYCRQLFNNRSMPDDSCSAPSSPEHRDPCWSDAEPEDRRLNVSRPSNPPSGYHEEAIIGALSSQRRSSGQHRREDLPPPPPPPAHLVDGAAGAETDDDSEPKQQHHRPRARHCDRQLPVEQVRSPNHSSGSMRVIRRIPLNSGDSESFEAPQVSLIAQLQQLERVQSLHQKQVAASSEKRAQSASGDDNEGLHEFFSLPLSVQLSALLARSLSREDRDAPPIDDFLNALNNSSIATSSRRSFRGPNQTQQQSKEAQQGGSWGRKQQVKLHNLQALINRLQKLHNQTALQQQLEELNGELDDDLLAKGSRQSTLSRSSHNKRRSRADLFDNNLTKSGDWTRSAPRSGKRTNNGSGSKTESIYSMSDSEDGAFVSRMLISYQQQHLKVERNVEPISTKKDDDQQVAESSTTSPDINSCVWPASAQEAQQELKEESCHEVEQTANRE